MRRGASPAGSARDEDVEDGKSRLPHLGWRLPRSWLRWMLPAFCGGLGVLAGLSWISAKPQAVPLADLANPPAHASRARDGPVVERQALGAAVRQVGELLANGTYKADDAWREVRTLLEPPEDTPLPTHGGGVLGAESRSNSMTPRAESPTLELNYTAVVVTPDIVALIAEFERTGRLPTFGITTGLHSNEGSSKCGKKLKRWCDGYCSRHGSQPPEELKLPGRLSKREHLSHLSQCFLWYTDSLFTRPTSGSQGIQIRRLGPGVDNKAFFVHAMLDYERHLGCQANQVYPPTLLLNDTDVCISFFNNNSKWAPSPNSLWFMKKQKGSTGRHISLKRRREIEQDATKVKCPQEGSIASLEVQNIWTINNRKWDHRIYVLVASLEPFVVLFRQGHLRFSVLNYTDDAPAQRPATNTGGGVGGGAGLGGGRVVKLRALLQEWGGIRVGDRGGKGGSDESKEVVPPGGIRGERGGMVGGGGHGSKSARRSPNYKKKRGGKRETTAQTFAKAQRGRSGHCSPRHQSPVRDGTHA